jgi:integrase
VAVLIDEWQADRLSGRSASYRAEAPKRLRIALSKYLKQPAASLDRTAAVQALTLAKRESGPVAANRIRAYARACFGWAVKRGSVPTNPFADVPVPAEEVARDRVLNDDELALVWAASETLSPPFRALVKLLILTGQRRGEVAGMRWSELALDGDAPHWTLPADRTKNGRVHDVPLSPEAVAVISACPRIVGNDFVLSTGPKAAPSGFGKVKERLDTHITKAMVQGNGGEGAAALAPWTLHDLRRTVATGLQRLGVRLEVTEAVLNHVSGTRTGIVGVYQRHQWTDEKRAALAAWAQHVSAIVTPAEAAANVASLAAERLRRTAAA